jgi:hypothetical protein
VGAKEDGAEEMTTGWNANAAAIARVHHKK